MTSSLPPIGIVGDPKRLLLDLAGHHHLSELLPLAVRRLAEGPAIALVRIWLMQPPLPDDCAKCRLAAQCTNRDRCLHLVASTGRSLDGTHASWDRLDGAFRRFPIGVRKVGQIARTGQSLEVADVAHDQAWAVDPTWIRDEQIASFAGHPLLHRGETHNACIADQVFANQ